MHSALIIQNWIFVHTSNYGTAYDPWFHQYFIQFRTERVYRKELFTARISRELYELAVLRHEFSFQANSIRYWMNTELETRTPSLSQAADSEFLPTNWNFRRDCETYYTHVTVFSTVEETLILCALRFTVG